MTSKLNTSLASDIVMQTRSHACHVEESRVSVDKVRRRRSILYTCSRDGLASVSATSIAQAVYSFAVSASDTTDGNDSLVEGWSMAGLRAAQDSDPDISCILKIMKEKEVKLLGMPWRCRPMTSEYSGTCGPD